jgi:hypothetical protein
MCAPVLPLIAAGVAAVGSGIKAISAAGQARAAAQVADANAVAERNAAQQDQENTRQATLKQYREIARVKGQQTVAAAANGVSTDFGTAADVVSDTNMLGREDIANIYRQGDNQLKSHDVNVANYGAQASAARSQASNALVSGAFDMGSSILGGVTQYNKMKSSVGINESVKKTINSRKNASIF